MASINANVWLACVLLASSLSVNPAIGQNDAPSNPTHLQMVANNDKIAYPPEMEKLIAALSGEWTTEDTYEGDDQTPTGRRKRSRESYGVGPARLSVVASLYLPCSIFPRASSRRARTSGIVARSSGGISESNVLGCCPLNPFAIPNENITPEILSIRIIDQRAFTTSPVGGPSAS